MLGMVLLSAGMLKMYSIYIPLSTDKAPYLTAVFVNIELGAELLLGTILLAGIWPKAAIRIALAFFVTAGCVAMSEAFRRLPSCGCFGRVPVPPAATASFDLFAVGVLAFSSAPPSSHTRWRMIVAGGILMAIIGTGTVLVGLRPRVIELTGNGDQQGIGLPGSLVVFEPMDWLGKPLPIASHINIGSQIAHGRWLILLVHHDCEDCRAAIARFQAMGTSAPPLAVIEMPPYADAGEKLVDAPTILGRLDTSHDWFATTPVALRLEDGTVRQAAEGNVQPLAQVDAPRP
jgi:uncharacterized membrane protein YoaK (UPF0700 family)